MRMVQRLRRRLRLVCQASADPDPDHGTVRRPYNRQESNQVSANYDAIHMDTEYYVYGLNNSFPEISNLCDFESSEMGDLCYFYQEDLEDDFDWTRHSGETPTNDTGPLTDHTLMNDTEIPNVCDFESSEMGDLCYFYQEDLRDDFDWTRHSGETPTNDTGPLTDHTLMNDTGHYMYIETTGQQLRDDAILKSVEFFKERTPCNVDFYYHAFGDHVGNLRLIFASDELTHDIGIENPSGIHVNEWIHYSRMFDYFGY
eukprot:XP_011676363.1 PREDICTED: MAM and LDL-receptor class A domain-containing protein 1-like [Strongylocentrotus purpuratus]